MKTTYLMALAASLVLTVCVSAERELVEAATSMDQLPQTVAKTLVKQLNGNKADEIDEIRYEGLPVLYKADYDLDGHEHEIAIRPNGEVVPQKQERDDDDDGEKDDVNDEDEIREREISIKELPKPVADALQKLVGKNEVEEIDEISYEGIVIGYDVEVDDVDEELFIYPYGGIAEIDGDVTERELSPSDLPRAIADALRKHLNGAKPIELEEVRYEGVPVLYEAEFERDGKVIEIAMFPDGRLADLHEDDEDEGEVEDDENDDDD